MPQSINQILAEIENLKDVLQILHSRRRILQRQEAVEGLQVRPQVLLEIDTIDIKTKECEQEIERLTKLLDGNETLIATVSDIPLPFELQLDFLQRRATLTEGQLRILLFIENAGYNRNYVRQDEIEGNFKQYGSTELFYRLDSLRLLGFIEKERDGTDSNGFVNFLYRLSEPYRRNLVNYRMPHNFTPSNVKEIKPVR